MKTKIYLIFSVFIAILVINACSPKLQVFEHNFIYKGKHYIIRSAGKSQKTNFGNQLIGNKFLAVDIDQDRIIDEIVKGNINLAFAQEVYDYCLQQLEKSGKLKEIKNSQREYYTTIKNYSFIIKCFNCKNGKPFTQFSITNIKSYKNITNVFIDKNKDMTLDERIKSNMQLKTAQKEYKKVIKKGINRNKIIIKNGVLFLK